MKVLLKRTFYDRGSRYRKAQDGTEIPDDAILPTDAEVWLDGKWVTPERDEEGHIVMRASKSLSAKDAEKKKDLINKPGPPGKGETKGVEF